MSIEGQAGNARIAALELQGYSSDDKNRMLYAIADGLRSCADEIMAANKLDLDNMSDKNGVFYERLTLTPARINNMVEGVKQIALLSDPVGKVVDEWTRPSGIAIKRVRSPLGVVAIIYEARPNVTIDAAALCIKSGNTVILRGSKGAINSNRVLYNIMRGAIENTGLNPECVQFIDDESREAVGVLLAQDKYIDAVIPRGGEGLKKFVTANSKIPVIASAGGNCHIFVEKTADLDKAISVIVNAKCQRPSVCNAAEHLLIDKNIADTFVPVVYDTLSAKGVEVYGDAHCKKIVSDMPAATDDMYDTEFEAMKITVKVVDGIFEAVEEINKHGTRHSEAILTGDKECADIFTSLVDAAAVYVNASTRFTDGFEYGFGAEMGISTGKLHARGPIGLEQLTSVRYIVNGNYSVRK